MFITEEVSQQPAAKATPSPTEKFREIVANIREEYLSQTQAYPWIIGFSGGKDSTLVAHAIFEALLSIEPSRRTRPVHLVSNDTLVESPLVIAHLKREQDAIASAALNLDLPVTVVSTHPEIEQTFWVILIGRGYGFTVPTV